MSPTKAPKKKTKVIGTVTHYYDKLGVGIVKLKGALKVGDAVTISRGEHCFTQTVNSIQIDHKEVQKAGKGKEVGVMLDEPIKEGAIVELT
jgi:translation initiation factor IF-2